MEEKKIFATNKKRYQERYSTQKEFLRYPADWVIRFHNMFMKKNIPTGKVLDYGCGSGNNSVFFLEKGYEVYGIDVAESVKDLIKINLIENGLDEKLIENFSIISPDAEKIEFEDNYFDFIISNQVLYYLPNQEHIKKITNEMKRCLKPDGVVFFTMMGPKNYYISEYTENINDNIYEINLNKKGHRLEGIHEYIYGVENETELESLFSNFECLSTGYFDQSMLDLKSNFHWIFIGKK